jgi:hypothetical protein
MRTTIKISPPNSLLFISDPAGGTVPEFVPGKLILSTTSCVSFGCYPEQDGMTEVTLGDAQQVDPGEPPAFDSDLDTPSHAIVVLTVERQTVLESKLRSARTRVRIWVNDLRWPNKVTIGLG